MSRKGKIIETKTNQRLPRAENGSREKLQISMRELLMTTEMF